MGHHYRAAQYRALQARAGGGAVFPGEGRGAAEYHQHKQHERGEWQCVSPCTVCGDAGRDTEMVVEAKQITAWPKRAWLV